MTNVVEGTENEADMLWVGRSQSVEKIYLGWIIKMGENSPFLVD